MAPTGSSHEDTAMTSPIGNFAGLGSGVDYQSIVDQIIQVESRPSLQFQSRISAANAQLAAYKTYSGLLSTLESAAKQMRDGTAFQGVNATVTGATTSGGRSTLSASAASGAAPGTYAVQVLQLAQAEKLSGAAFAGNAAALGLAGDFVLNGRNVAVVAADSLTAIRDKINAVNAGTAPSGVVASVVTDSSGAQRLVLTAQKTGSDGINMLDGAQGVARQLGWIDSTESIKHPTSSGALSDSFSSSTATIASQLGLATAPGPQTVTIGGRTVTLDLGSDSLTSIAGKLSSLTGIQATVQSSVTGGVTRYYLDVRNTTSFVDSGNALGQLGILVGGRSAVAQTIQGSALTTGGSSTPATASTLLSTLWNGGSPSGASAGDTLTIAGKRGDGSAVNLTFTIGVASTIQNVLDTLNNSTNGFGSGARPAVASIDSSGRITVSDGTAGQSALSLQIVANNQGGGRLDFGAFNAVTPGRARELVAGADALLSVDGVSFTRPSNTVNDVISGTTLTLSAADPTVTANVTVQRSTSDAKDAVQQYVDAYNKLVDFVKQQQTPGTGGSANPALYNDGILRQARSALSNAMLTTVSGAAGGLTTAGMAGISLTKDGHLSLDASKFTDAFSNRFDDLQKLFLERGTSSNPALNYTSSTSATRAGTYDVNITAAATQATVLGAGFSGTYADDATPDIMAVTDVASNSTARIQLSSGMTSAQIVDALNAAFSTPQARSLESASSFTDLSTASTATAATLLTNLRGLGAPLASMAAGDTISFGGVRPDSIPYTDSFVIGPNSTVSDLVARIQTSLGSSARVTFAGGKLSLTSASTGPSPMTLSLTAGNQGGGGFSFGTVDVKEDGHNALPLTASSVGSQIRITHGSYGSAAGFSVSFVPGGADGTAQLGIPSGQVRGTDVQGTIGGFAASGSGQQLVGASGTPVDGLSVGYRGSSVGAIGSITLNEGVGAIVDRLLKTWNDSGGTVATKQTQINDQIAVQQKRLDDFKARMEVRRQSLLKQYLAMDTTVQRLRAQGNSFLSAIGGMSAASRQQ